MPETTFITDPEELETLLELPEPVDRLAAAALPLRIPRELAKRIGKGDPNDPILLQFRPSARENDSPQDSVPTRLRNGRARRRERRFRPDSSGSMPGGFW